MYEIIGIIGWIVAIVCVVGLICIAWGTKDDAESEPDGNMSGPSCYGDYPFNSSAKLADRECWNCIYKAQCYERTTR